MIPAAITQKKMFWAIDHQRGTLRTLASEPAS